MLGFIKRSCSILQFAGVVWNPYYVHVNRIEIDSEIFFTISTEEAGMKE